MSIPKRGASTVFFDSYNLAVDPPWYSNSVYGIDKGCSMIMVENYLNGLIWNTYTNSPYIQNTLGILGFRKRQERNRQLNTFHVKDGQFWLKDQPQFIQAGEFHYFRSPADQWAHRLGLLQNAGFNTVAAYIPWLWHQPQPKLSDPDGLTNPMLNLAGVPLLGGHSLSLPARNGAILPLEWQVKPGILIHYLTPEVIEVSDEGTRLTLKTAQAELFAEVILTGYRCDDSLIVERSGSQRLTLHGENGVIELVAT